MPSQEALLAALAKVNDPEIRKPITELGMVEAVTCDEAGLARVTILLTISGCPLKDTLTKDSTAALLTWLSRGLVTEHITRAVPALVPAWKWNVAAPELEPSTTDR